MVEIEQDHRAFVVPILRSLEVDSILRCAVDAPEKYYNEQESQGSLPFAQIDSCSADALAHRMKIAEQSYDAIWFHGYITWHSLQEIEGTLARAIEARRAASRRLPTLVVQCKPYEGLPDWSPPESLAAQIRRVGSTRQGIQTGFVSLLYGHGYVNRWFSIGGGVGLAVPEEGWRVLGPLTSAVDVLVKSLMSEQQCATEATALAYESQAQVDSLTVRLDASTSAPMEEDRSLKESRWLMESYAGRTDLEDLGGVQPTLARRPDGRIFILENGLRRHVPSGLVAQVLQQILGPPVQMASDELGEYTHAPPLHVIQGSKGSRQLIVCGRRIPLRGFPTVAVIPESELTGFDELTPVNVNRMRFPVGAPMLQPKHTKRRSPQKRPHIVARLFSILKKAAVRS